MTISSISSQPMSFDDPLTLLPDEPRFTVSPLLQDLEMILPENSITCTYTTNNQSFIASKNLVLIFNKKSLVSKVQLSNNIMITTLNLISNYEVQTLLIGTSHGHIYGAIIDYDDMNISQNYFVFLVVQSQQVDSITKIVVQEQNFSFITQKNKLYINSFNQNKIVSQNIELLQLDLVKLLDICYSSKYLIILTSCQVLFVEKTKNTVFYTYDFKQSLYGTLCIDFCCLYVGVNDTVYTFYLPIEKVPSVQNISPLALGIHFSLTGDGKIQSMNDDQLGSDFIRQCTFNTNECEWDGADNEDQKVHNFIQSNEQINRQNLQFVSKFQLQDPQLLILKIQPFGEHLAIVGVSDPQRISEYQQNEDQNHQEFDNDGVQSSYNFWLEFNSQNYSYSDLETSQPLVHLAFFDIFGAEIHGCILPIVNNEKDLQLIKNKEKIKNYVFEFVRVSSNLLKLDSYVLSCNNSILLLQQLTERQHIQYLIDNEHYSLAMQTAILLHSFGNTQLTWREVIQITDQQVKKKEDFYSSTMQQTELIELQSTDYPSAGFAFPGLAELKMANYLQQQNQLSNLDLFSFDRQKKQKQPDIQQFQLLSQQFNRSSVQQLVLTLCKFFLDNQKVIQATELLSLLSEQSMVWQGLLVQFGFSPNLSLLLNIIPKLGSDQHKMVLALSLSSNFQQFTKLIMRYQQDCLPDQLQHLLQPIGKHYVSSEIHASLAYIFYLEKNYVEAIRLIINKMKSVEQASMVYTVICNEIIDRGSLDMNEDGKRNKFYVSTDLITMLIQNADLLFSLNFEKSALVYAKIITNKEQVLEVFVDLLILTLKKALGTPPYQKLNKNSYSNDSRMARDILIQHLLIVRATGSTVYPVVSFYQPIMSFLIQFCYLNNPVFLNCLEDNTLTIQDFAILYAGLSGNKDTFASIQFSCKNTNFRETLQLLKDFSELENYLLYLLQYQMSQEISPEIQINVYQMALEITLQQGTVQQAIDFIRKLYDLNSNNQKNIRIIKQAGLWRCLTKFLANGKGVLDLLQYISKESVPIDVNEVFDYLQIDSEADMHGAMYDLIDSLRVMLKLQQECSQLVQQDCVILRNSLINQARKGLTARTTTCQVCGIEKLKVDEAQDYRSDDFIVFQCGHSYHKQCLGLDEDCGVCNQKVNQ